LMTNCLEMVDRDVLMVDRDIKNKYHQQHHHHRQKITTTQQKQKNFLLFHLDQEEEYKQL